MDFIEAFKDAPLWLQIYLVILQLGALLPAYKLLQTVYRWIHMKAPKIYTWIKSIDDERFWLFHKPNIQLITRPSRLTKSNIDLGIEYSTNFMIRLENKNSEPCAVSLHLVKMLIKQGSGKRTKKIALSLNSRETKPDLVLESSKPQNISVFLKQSIYTPDAKTNIILDKSYKWKISDIQAKVIPLEFRKLQSFKGKQYNLQ